MLYLFEKPAEQPQSLTTTVAKRVPLILLPINGELNDLSENASVQQVLFYICFCYQITHIFCIDVKLPAKFYSPQLHEEITFSSIAAESTPLSETEKNNSAKESIDSPTVVSVNRAQHRNSVLPVENNPVGILKYDEKTGANRELREKKREFIPNIAKIN